VIHAPASFQPEPGMTYRVDVARGELVTLANPQDSRREFIERVRAEQERKARERALHGQEPPAERPSTAGKDIEASRSSGRKTKRHKN
jgi:hypothetical protein